MHEAFSWKGGHERHTKGREGLHKTEGVYRTEGGAEELLTKEKRGLLLRHRSFWLKRRVFIM